MNDLELLGTLSELLAEVAEYVTELYNKDGVSVELAEQAASRVDYADAVADATSFTLILLMKALEDET